MEGPWDGGRSAPCVMSSGKTVGREQSRSKEREEKGLEVKDLVGKLRTVTFTLSKTGSCWRVWREE